MAIYLVRHAQSEWNAEPMRFQGRADVGLSEYGKSQIARYAIRLPKFSAGFVSPARRCRETVERLLPEIVQVFSVEPDPRLWEIDNGWFSGKTVAEVELRDGEHFRRWLATPEVVRPGDGELVAEMRARVKGFISEVVNWYGEENGEHALVMTHGGPIRTLVSPIKEFHRIRVPNLATFMLVGQGEEYRIARVSTDDRNESAIQHHACE